MKSALTLTQDSMHRFLAIIFLVLIFLPAFPALSEQQTPPVQSEGSTSASQTPPSTLTILASLLELRANLNDQLKRTEIRLAEASSETIKASLEEERARLDRQLAENYNDFERIATGIESGLFLEKAPGQFSWKDEMASLMEPAIKELKRFTVRARHKTELKERIATHQELLAAASKGLLQLQALIAEGKDPQIGKEVAALLPEWQATEQRLKNRLELDKQELAKLEDQEISLVESSSRSVATFFKERGFFLLVALLTFFAVLLFFRLLYRLIVKIALRITRQPEERSLHIRLLYLAFQVLSVAFAVIGLFFVLYLAEDWFLLSMAIVFFLGLAWTIRQAIPKLWQQARLMLNVGAIRENERLVLHGVPWRVASLNVFCRLENPSLGVELRVPIEQLVGMTSRPWSPEEPWFPCRKGDWVVVGSNSRAKVVSLSHEQIELVERGGRRIYYPTSSFLEASPANLSRNFRLRVPFGLSYDLQAEITTTIPAILKEHLSQRLEEEGYAKSCLNLQVEFLQAGPSSLDLLVLADMDGRVADIATRIERALQRYCVECCTAHGWEIPFPQLTVHRHDPVAAATDQEDGM